MITNFLPLRIYKKLDILTNHRRIKRITEILTDDECTKLIYDQQYIFEEYEDVTLTEDSPRTFIYILSPNSKYEQGDSASDDIKKLFKKMPGYIGDDLINIIFITKEILNNYRIKALTKVKQEHIYVQNIQYFQIFADPLNYIRAVEMNILSKEDEQEVLDWVSVPKSHFPKIITTDICSLYLNIKPDDMVEIIRNEDCGNPIGYRVCVPG